MPTTCFMLEPTNRLRRFLRRYQRVEGLPNHLHNAMVLLDEIPFEKDESGEEIIRATDPAPFLESHREQWPQKCACGYEFTEEDHYQIFSDRIYERSDTHELIGLRDAPPGAMWYADWMGKMWSGADGHALMAVCPNGCHWLIDGPANNCTKPEDHEHRCWIRHGVPPVITVDKDGNTCSAGAGSIQAGDYHGHLQNGVFNP